MCIIAFIFAFFVLLLLSNVPFTGVHLWIFAWRQLRLWYVCYAQFNVHQRAVGAASAVSSSDWAQLAWRLALTTTQRQREGGVAPQPVDSVFRFKGISKQPEREVK